ncbi:unnamed protein product [Miscanthus lutarioriparius]|uniref:MADS-box domain-containing protein n=1 Tax=Miscanthus lutarioriparius TaxID=422564 RepID=A0A811SDV6_9POAL|nr:unnamed protein product [Miscanthus lutarioriparius]
MVKPAGKEATSKGKHRNQIEYIEDKEKRQVTSSKRKGGLLKKASELHLLCGAHVAIVIFSHKQDANPNRVAAAARPGGRRSSSTRRRGGNVFAMGTPSVDHVMSRLAAVVPLAGCGENYHRAALEEDAAVAGREGAEATAQRRDEARELVDAEEARMKAVADKVWRATAVGRFWWEADVEALSEAELPEFGGALKRLRDNVLRRHADKLVLQ